MRLGLQPIALEQQGLPLGIDAVALGAKLLALCIETLPLQDAIRFRALAFRHQLGFEALTLRVEQRSNPLAFGIQVGGRALSLGVEQRNATLPFAFDFLIGLFADSHRRKRGRLFGLGAKTCRRLRSGQRG